MWNWLRPNQPEASPPAPKPPASPATQALALPPEQLVDLVQKAITPALLTLRVGVRASEPEYSRGELTRRDTVAVVGTILTDCVVEALKRYPAAIVGHTKEEIRAAVEKHQQNLLKELLPAPGQQEAVDRAARFQSAVLAWRAALPPLTKAALTQAEDAFSRIDGDMVSLHRADFHELSQFVALLTDDLIEKTTDIRDLTIKKIREARAKAFT